MRILISSHAFSPSVGGIETCTLQLARGLETLGHSVRVVTQTPSRSESDDLGFSVLRQPSPSRLLAAFSECDVFYQNNISLQTLWPLLVLRKPWCVTTATWLHDLSTKPPLSALVKRFLLQFASNIYISDAIARHIGAPGQVIPNPYNDDIFFRNPDIPKEADFLFVGRLVPDKGCSLLLEALAELRSRGLRPGLTVVGDGELRAFLEGQAAESVPDQVTFLGALSPEDCARQMNRHRVIVVPSIWEEPFGVVAVEGIACGCVAVASRSGGLPDAVGPCGFLFERESKAALSEALLAAMSQPDAVTDSDRLRHVARHKRKTVAVAHEAVFSVALNKSKR